MKKLVVALLCAVFLTATMVSEGVCEVTVNIDQILQGISITGFVKGVPKDQVGNYRVVVYVHTDVWYIHPYAAGGEGDSWAAIKPNGSWTLKTVKRQFAANAVAALVVKADGYDEKTPIQDVAAIPHVGIIILDKPELKKRKFYGKL